MIDSETDRGMSCVCCKDRGFLENISNLRDDGCVRRRYLGLVAPEAVTGDGSGCEGL